MRIETSCHSLHGIGRHVVARPSTWVLVAVELTGGDFLKRLLLLPLRHYRFNADDGE